MNLEIVPCSVEHLEKLIEGTDAFQTAFGLQVSDEYMPFAGALEFMLHRLQTSQLKYPWLPYLVVFHPDRSVVGLCGFKSVPDSHHAIEIGYSIAPSYQGKGFATIAACQLINIAFESTLVDCVFAHTLAENNASTRVLAKCGMTKVGDAIEPDVGNVWKWEICTAMSNNLQSQIIELEERLRQAMLSSDVAELDALIAPELLFTNHLGQRFTKEEDLEAHRTGRFKFTEITPSDRQIQFNTGFTVVSVLTHILGSYEGTPVEQNIRFTRVWAISSSSSIQIIAGHTSALPGN
jgi:[ribosomal protein S5]-alanine N-acetyltransferase